MTRGRRAGVLGRFDALYRRLPVSGQHAAVSLYGVYWFWLRFGPGAARARDDFSRRERYSDADWEAWQKTALRDALYAAAKDVPYYSRVWSESEKRSALAGQLRELPLLSKEAIRSDPEAFLRRDVRPRPRFAFHTSGSTGTPVRTIWTISEIRASMALREVRSARWAGVSFREPRATFSGRLIVPDPKSEGPFHRFNAVERQVYLSAFHLRPETAKRYVAALNRHRVRWLTGYAVSYYLLARLMLSQGLKVAGLKAVITTSEKVTDEMRRVMEEAYGCRVFEEYSNVENSLFASECEARRLHVSPDVGFVEILRSDGAPCEPGETGEIVCTTLMRWYQPLIRYRLGDMGRSDEGRCRCGRAMPILREIVGRVEDVVVGPDGRQLVRFHGVFIDQPHVREGQIIQETLTGIRVRIVPNGTFGPADSADIAARIRQRLGPDVHVEVELVEDIPRSAAGKFQAVISRLSGEQRAPVEGPPLQVRS